MSEQEATPPAAVEDGRRPWLTAGVGGIGTASFLADVGHEVPTALMASFVTSTLGAPAAALGLFEGVSEGLAGAGRFVSVGRWPMTPPAAARSPSAATPAPRCSRR